MNQMRFRSTALAAVLFTGLAASTVTFAQQAVAPAAAEAPKFKAPVLTNAELDALLAKPESVLIVDVRRPDEISKVGGFPVYLNIQPTDIAANAKLIPRDRAIVTVSNHARARAVRPIS